jgi:hypothetical protein
MRLPPALLACALLGCALLGCQTTHTPKPVTSPTAGATPAGPTATAPSSFVRTTAEAPAIRNVEVRDGLTHQQAMRTLVDALSERYVVDVVDPRAGFAMTTWQANLMREGVPDLRYRTRVVARFVDEWRSLQIRSEARYARAQRDSAARADSVRRDSTARADSVARAQLVGGMVDSAALAEKRRQDSIADAARQITTGVLAAIRRYTSAIQRGDFAAARRAYPSMTEQEQKNWEGALAKFNLRFLVEPPRQVHLSSGDSVANVDVVTSVQYIDKTTKQATSTPKRTRHATLVRQPSGGWQLTSFSPQ